jgi:hypothetical protein
MGGFYQQQDHRMILLSASIGEPGRIPGFPFVKHPQGTRFSNFRGNFRGRKMMVAIGPPKSRITRPRE